MTNTKKSEIPVGFSMALSVNPDAMQKFEALDETQKQSILAGTRDIKSKEEMRKHVNSLVNPK